MDYKIGKIYHMDCEVIGVNPKDIARISDYFIHY